MITDRDLTQMGFKRTDETIKSSKQEVDKWYYTFEIGDLTFITNSIRIYKSIVEVKE